MYIVYIIISVLILIGIYAQNIYLYMTIRFISGNEKRVKKMLSFRIFGS